MITEIFKNWFRRFVTIVLATFAVTEFPGLYATDLDADYQPTDVTLFVCHQFIVVGVDISNGDGDGDGNGDGVYVGQRCSNAAAMVKGVGGKCEVLGCTDSGPGCYSYSCDLKRETPVTLNRDPSG